MKIFFAISCCLMLGVTFGQTFRENIPVDSAGHYAFIDKNGTVLTDWKRLDGLEIRTLDRLYIGKYKGKYGLLDSCLNWRLEPQFSSIEKHHKKLIAKKGNEVIIYSEKLDSITSFQSVISIEFESGQTNIFSESSAVHKTKTIIKTAEGTGIVDENYKWIVKPVYDDAFFQNAIIYLRKGDHFGFISVADKVIEPVYASIGMFNPFVMELENAAGYKDYFLMDGSKIPHSDSTLVVERLTGFYKTYTNGKAELYDYDLKKVVSYSGEDIFTIKSAYFVWKNNQYARAGQPEFAIRRGDKIGVIDQNGKELISCQYQHVMDGGKDFYIIMNDGKFGVIDKTENVVIPTEYNYISRDQNFFKIYKQGKKGYMNLKGEVVIPCEFQNVHISAGGFLAEKNSRLGYFKPDGSEVLPPVFERAYQINGGLELVRNKKSTMVNKNGLLSLPDCDKVSRNGNTIKYYKGGYAYVHCIKDEKITDTTIYQVPERVTIHDRWTERDHINMSEHPCETFTSQQNGKIGSIYKNRDGFAIVPQFFNIYNVKGYEMVKMESEDFVNLGKAFVSSKDVVLHFDGGIGALGEPIISYLAPGSFSGWHTSSLDPCITQDKRWKYYSDNKYGNPEFSCMLKRSGFASVGLLQGEVNFSSGQDLKPYREMYNDMNAAFTLKISSEYEFGRMSVSPMIKIEDPVWQVITAYDDMSYKKTGDYEYLEMLPGSNIIFKEIDGDYGILHRHEKKLLEPIAKEIKPVFFDEFEFYLVNLPVKDSLGNEILQWTVYNFEGQVLPETYDKVEVVTNDYFKVTKNGATTLINREGKEIWRYAFADLVSENR